MATRFTNRSKFTDHMVWSVFNWGRKEMGVEPINVLKVYDYDDARGFRGTAYRYRRQIIVRAAMTNEQYPGTQRYPGERNAPTHYLRDCYDAFAYATFHELGHFLFWQQKGDAQPRDLETQVELLHKPTFDKFQHIRNDLFRSWFIEPEREFFRGDILLAMAYCG